MLDLLYQKVSEGIKIILNMLLYQLYNFSCMFVKSKFKKRAVEILNGLNRRRTREGNDARREARGGYICSPLRGERNVAATCQGSEFIPPSGRRTGEPL